MAVFGTNKMVLLCKFKLSIVKILVAYFDN